MNIGDIFLRVLLDGSNVQTDAQRIGNQAGQTMGQRLGKGLKAGMAFGAIAGGVAAVLAPLATAADSALDSIRASTGLIGDELAAVQDDFRAVAGQVPDDLDTVSAVVSDLQRRTGLTGEALRSLSEQVLDFSRATATDAVQNAALATRVFGDWSIATEDQEAALDALLRTSQATGIGVDKLQASVVQFGAPLRQLGFSFEESIALLGKFEKEGVNVDTVLAGLRQGLARIAKAGEEPAEALARVQEEIKNAGSAAEANRLAIETFGARAGPDMAAAIREGRFELGELFDTVTNGGDTVRSVTEDTEDAADGFAGFLNTATLALGEFAAPLAGFSEVAGPMLYTLPLLTSGIGAFAGMITATVIPALLAVGKVLLALIASTGPIGLVVLAVGALFVAWQTNFLGIQEIVGSVIDTIGRIFSDAIRWFGNLWDGIADAISGPVDVIIGVIGGIVGVVDTVARAVGALFDFITGGTTKAIRQIDQTRYKAQLPSAPTTTTQRSGAAVQAFQSGAWAIPNNQMAMLHAGEMVVPPGAAQALRDWFGGDFWAGRETGGDVTNINLTVEGKEPIVSSAHEIAEQAARLGRFGNRRG